MVERKMVLFSALSEVAERSNALRVDPERLGDLLLCRTLFDGPGHCCGDARRERAARESALSRFILVVRPPPQPVRECLVERPYAAG